MRRLLLIPVAGTIAALVVILLAHEPREEEPGPIFPEPPPTLPEGEGGVHDTTRDDATAPEKKPETKKEKSKKKKQEKREPPPPPPSEYRLQLEKDGSLVDLDSSRSFADSAAVIAGLGHAETRHRIILSKGEGVEEAALDELLEGLSARFDVRKFYRAPEKEK